MILEAALKLIFGIVDLLISAIPTITLPDNFFTGMDSVTTLMNDIAYVLPVSTFVMCISIIFMLHNARLIVSIFNFVIRKIPGVN